MNGIVIRKEREREKERKEVDIPWFTQKANKAPAQDLLCSCRPQAPSQCSEGALPWEPSREGLRSPGRKVNSEGLCAPGDQPEKEREREREGKNDTGRPSFSEQGPQLYFQKELFYTLSCTQRTMEDAESCRVSSPDPY